MSLHTFYSISATVRKVFLYISKNTTLKNLMGYMTLTYSITGLLVILGVAGKHILAADVAIVQGAALATFYVMSGDARHLILAGKSNAINVVSFRVVWVIPLAFLSYFMSTTVGQVDYLIALSLILRRSAEWLAEPHVTEIERKGEGWFGLYLQPLLMLMLIGQIMITNDFWVIWIWAISPIFFSFTFIKQANLKRSFDFAWENITSTAVIGFTGYIQRVLIVSFVGKEFSGMLFPGFAIGSFLGTMAANVAGPTLVNKGLLHSKYLITFFVLLLLTGCLVLFFSEGVLYKTMGLSIIGGVAMIAAQQSRLLLLKNEHTLELDLLFQLALIFSIPALYFLAGLQGLVAFYFTGSLLAWFFYKGNNVIRKISFNWRLRLSSFIILGLIFPIFFQLSGNIYNNELIALIDSGGDLKTVPLPVSLLVCYLGVFLFSVSVSFSQSKPAVLTILTMFLLLVVSTMITNQGTHKLILLMQYIIPTVALLLGTALVDFDRKLIAKVLLYFLMVFVPVQLLMTWFAGRLALTHYMYLFSVYSHYQYVPLIFAGLYAWAFVELRVTHGKKLFFLAPWMGLYVAAGNSTLALFGLLAFVSIYAVQAIFVKKSWRDILVPLMMGISVVTYFYINMHLSYDINVRLNSRWECQSGELQDGLNGPCLPGLYEGKFFDEYGNLIHFPSLSNRGPGGKNRKLADYESSHDHESSQDDESSQKEAMPINVIERKAIALIYIKDMLENPSTMIYGHASPPDRSTVSSAHNYYLDLSYNFGALACLPLLMLILYTIYKVYKQRNEDSSLIWLLAIVMYFVIADNLFKVTLRQPYPGVAVFFLWGALLGMLNPTGVSNKSNEVKLES